MDKVNVGVVAVLVGMLAAAPLLANDGTESGKKGEAKGHADHFAAADVDGNGSISLEEFKTVFEKRRAMMKERMGDKYDAERAAKMPSAEKIFAKIDKDGNGALSKEEMKQAHPRGGRRGAHGKGGGEEHK